MDHVTGPAPPTEDSVARYGAPVCPSESVVVAIAIGVGAIVGIVTGAVAMLPLYESRPCTSTVKAPYVAGNPAISSR